jgi:hypothetical protein
MVLGIVQDTAEQDPGGYTEKMERFWRNRHESIRFHPQSMKIVLNEGHTLRSSQRYCGQGVFY